MAAPPAPRRRGAVHISAAPAIARSLRLTRASDDARAARQVRVAADRPLVDPSAGPRSDTTAESARRRRAAGKRLGSASRGRSYPGQYSTSITAIVEAVAEALPGASGIDVEFGAGARKRQRTRCPSPSTAASQAGSREPHRRAPAWNSLAQDRLRDARKKDRACAIASLPPTGVTRFRTARTARGSPRTRAASHDRERDQNFQQREARRFASGAVLIAAPPVPGSRPAAPARNRAR